MSQQHTSITSLIQEPLTIVDNILQTNIQSHGFHAEAVKATIHQVQELYQNSFRTREEWNTIPLLNDTQYKQSKLPRQSLVRVRCMVQDMMDQEMFPGVFRCSENRYSSALFRDEIQEDSNDDDEIDGNDPRNFILSDRSVLYCVPVPGESQWARQLQQASIQASNQGSANGNTVNRKRTRRDEDNNNNEDESMDVDQEEEQVQSLSEIEKKRVKSETMSEQESSNHAQDGQSLKQAYTLDYPLPGETEIPFLIKMFDTKGSDDRIALCDIIEVIGVLAENTSQFSDEYTKEDESELLTVYPPQSLVPRIHCIAYKKTHSVHQAFADESKISVVKNVLPTLRSTIVSYIAQTFHCDQLVGQYVLLHMLSRIYSRVGSMNLGKLVLNITRCPSGQPDFSSKVEFVFSSILPAIFLLKLSPTNLSRMRFGPRKDFSTNKLNSGILQLAQGTHLIVDENALDQGEIREQALLNMQLLQAVINQSIVSYDFVYNRMELPTDLNICILSEGRSIFKLGVDCTVPMVSVDTTQSIQLSDDQLQLIRQYLSIVNSLNAGYLSSGEAYSISANVAKAAESDFVEARNGGAHPDTSITADDFHRWLSLARLITLSHGDTQLSQEHWNTARQLEKDRSDRVTQFHPSS